MTHRPEMDGDVHVTPVGDAIDHDVHDDCVCGPYVEYVDPETGEAYPHGARVVVHHSLDGREGQEWA